MSGRSDAMGIMALSPPIPALTLSCPESNTCLALASQVSPSCHHQSPGRATHQIFPSQKARKVPGPPLLCLRGLSGLLGVDLLAVLVVSDPRGRGTVATAFARAHAHDLAVDGAADAVLELQVHFGHRVVGEDGGVGDITCSN